LLNVGIILDRLLPSAQHTGDLFAARPELTPRQAAQRRRCPRPRPSAKTPCYFGGAHGATGYAPMRIAVTRIPNPKLEDIDALPANVA